MAIDLYTAFKQAVSRGLIPNVSQTNPDSQVRFLLNELTKPKATQRADFQAVLTALQNDNTALFNAVDSDAAAQKAALTQANTDLTTLSGGL